ncbi:hypothetical protein BKA70DRAFT_839177 [Coprinopsis sp. MPI-PUGE-AT-0042]|nr:hypothetical protein BKA70DRAFT_839177 [Coprinopsis sp. MPI-PUGE-AT-0042]
MMSILEQMEDQDTSLHTTHPLPQDFRRQRWLAQPMAIHCTFRIWTSSPGGKVSFSTIVSTAWHGGQPSSQSQMALSTFEVSTSWLQAHRQQEFGWIYGEISCLPSVGQKLTSKMGTGNAECFQDDLALSLQPHPSRSLLDPNCAPEIPSNAFGASVKSISTPFARATISNRDFTKPGLRQPRPGEYEIARAFEFLESIDDRPAHVQPNRLQTVTSPYVKRLALLLR